MSRAGIILPVALVLGMAAVWAAGPLLPFGGDVVTAGAPTVKAAALTFDDGPSASATSQVLDILQAYGVKATFFTVGSNVQRHPELAQRIVAEGHQIGLHSYNHSILLPYWLPPQVSADTKKAARAIAETTGKEPHFYRPPHGRTSPWMRWTLHRNGKVIVGWSVSPRDWEAREPSAIVDKVMSTVRPGAIVLLHDGLDREMDPDRTALIAALPTLIMRLEQEGYRLVTVAELLGIAP